MTKITGDGIELYSSSSNPSNPVVGQVYYNSSDKEMRQWDGYTWQQVAVGDGGFKYRTVITTSYVMCGYKSGTPYNNVNRMVHSTDVCSNLGNLMAYTASYSGGAPGLTKAWVFSAANAHATASVNCIALNMTTEAGIAYSSNNNMGSARNDAGYAFKETEYCHVTSDNDSDKFNFTTETCSVGFSSGIINNGTGGGVQALCDQHYAHLYGDSTGQTLAFATDTIANDRLEAAAWNGINNQQKPQNTKNRKGYTGNEGTYNGGYNYRVYDMNTNALARTVARPVTNSGEENFDMGQETSYMLGCYDGAQNNRGQKFYHTTDSGYELGTGSVRTGIPGGSSGICGWKG